MYTKTKDVRALAVRSRHTHALLHTNASLYALRVKGVSLRPPNRLVGLVVKASASRAEDPGCSNPACAGIFFGVESYQ